MSFTPVTPAVFQDENIASTPVVAASKKRKRLTEQSPPKEIATKRSTLAMTNGNAEHTANGQDTLTEANDNNKDRRYGSDPDISSTAAAALTAHLNEEPGLSFGSQTSAAEERPQGDSFDMDASNQRPSSSGYPYSPTQGTPRSNGASSQKPAVGSEEWHRVRRDNHKEVERRRRETINEGINELAKIVPGCEKNKGAVLAQAVTYIRDLKHRQDMATEQNAMEKSVLEQAVNELMKSNEKLKDRVASLEERNRAIEQRLGDEDVLGD